MIAGARPDSDTGDKDVVSFGPLQIISCIDTASQIAKGRYQTKLKISGNFLSCIEQIPVLSLPGHHFSPLAQQPKVIIHTKPSSKQRDSLLSPAREQHMGDHLNKVTTSQVAHYSSTSPHTVLSQLSDKSKLKNSSDIDLILSIRFARFPLEEELYLKY